MDPPHEYQQGRYSLETPGLVIEGIPSATNQITHTRSRHSRQSTTGSRQTPCKSMTFQSTILNAIQKDTSEFPCHQYLWGKRLRWQRLFSNSLFRTPSPHTQEPSRPPEGASSLALGWSGHQIWHSQPQLLVLD